MQLITLLEASTAMRIQVSPIVRTGLAVDAEGQRG